MSTRRVPLSSNPNAANSPMRASSAAVQAAKKARSHADMLREEAYGQPPPAKRQMIERSVGSPSRSRATRTFVHRAASRATVGTRPTEKGSQPAVYQPSEQERLSIQQWQVQTRARFPKMVFYFESIPDEQRSTLAKRVGQLGAREEKFFSNVITHVVTTRPIPSEKPPQDDNQAVADMQAAGEQPKTIDPSLLNRASKDPTILATDSLRRKLLLDALSSRKPPGQMQEDAIKRPRGRSTDVLHRAREMGKKIWSLDKLQRILEMALDPDPYERAVQGHSRGNAQNTGKANEESNLLQLLENERVHGPSDRDPTVSTKDLHYFKGPYIYVYDLDEKTKPIMAREYPKVGDPKDGEWPQFRSASRGRCPFVQEEDYDPEKENREARRPERRAEKAAAETAPPEPRPSEAPVPKPTTGKRTLAQMEDGHNRGTASVQATESFDRSRVSNPPSLEFRTQNAFMSHAKAGRFLAGEPVASGVQPSNVTSAIRSQMISSTTGGVLGAKAGTSKEIHGLQRKVVLQKASTPAVSQDLSSRRMAEMSHDSNSFVGSASMSRAAHRKLDIVDEEEVSKRRGREKLQRTASAPAAQPKKRDPKPGYCENCQVKFADFEEHIISRRHRRFAENDENWAQLDALLAQLERMPRY
ncbi:hypothetical protein VTK56DRAFT_8464 [Thermocarpiscus australiensis]